MQHTYVGSLAAEDIYMSFQVGIGRLAPKELLFWLCFTDYCHGFGGRKTWARLKTAA